jgi:peptide deformylase
MILMKNIIREGNELLRKESVDVKLPLSNEDKTIMLEMLGYLFNSQNDAKAKELGLRPGVGLAAPQIGINKKMFAILANDMEGKTHLLPVINPKIVKRSKEVTYLPGGEGCLSVDRETCGITPRNYKIWVECYLYNLQTGTADFKKFELEDYIAIVFQHEYDHLFGTLFVDTIMTEEEAATKGMFPLWDTEE